MKLHSIDTHVHLLVSKKQNEPDWVEIKKILDMAYEAGLTAVCVTEHAESAGYRQLMKSLFEDNVYNGQLAEGGVILPSGLMLYPGAEVQLSNGTNVGVHAPLQTLMELNTTAGFYSLDELEDYLQKVGKTFALVAHHIYWEGKTFPDHDRLAEVVSAIEVPAKDSRNSDKYRSLAEKYALPNTGGSDAHTFIQIGACYTQVQQDGEHLSHEAFISSLREGSCMAQVSPAVERLVTTSKLYRKHQMA